MGKREGGLKAVRTRRPEERLAGYMAEGLRPLKKAMRFKAAVEITAPLHNAVMCLMLAIQAQRSQSRKPAAARRD